jgi:hypothetical protein
MTESTVKTAFTVGSQLLFWWGGGKGGTVKFSIHYGIQYTAL